MRPIRKSLIVFTMAMLGAGTLSLPLQAIAAGTVITTPARIGFSSTTVGFNAVNNRVAGTSEYAAIWYFGTDGLVDMSIPVSVTSSNSALVSVTAAAPGNPLGNFILTVPLNAPAGTAIVTANATVGGVAYTRARSFVISPAAVTQAPLVSPTSTTVRAATPTLAADQSGCTTINYYDVGPGQPFTALGQLPWSQLQGCDTVRIYAKPNNGTYNEMILVSAGTNMAPAAPNKFMRVIGLPDPVTGARPIIDGTNATQWETLPGQAPRTLQYHDNSNPTRALYRLGLVMVGPQWGYNYNNGPAGYIGIENLEIRNANYGGAFNDAMKGVSDTYSSFGSCVYVEAAAHFVLKNNLLHDCGNGLFMNSKNSTVVELSQDILIEGNSFYNNSNPPIAGVTSGYHEHQSYTEARDIIFQYNTFGNVKAGAFGDCLKDRSSGLIVRYNTFAGTCGILLNLMDSTGGQGLIWGDPAYGKTHIYGNLFDLAPTKTEDTTLFNYGGDSGIAANYRQGTLYFYNNTMVVKGDAGHGIYPEVYLFNLNRPNAVADVRNNVFQTTPTTPGLPGKIQVMAFGVGSVNLSNNWVSPNAAQFWVGHYVGAVVNGWNTNLGANNQSMFANAALHNYRPAAGSPLINSGASLSDLIANAVTAEPGTAAARKLDAAIDIGAFEY